MHWNGLLRSVKLNVLVQQRAHLLETGAQQNVFEFGVSLQVYVPISVHGYKATGHLYLTKVICTKLQDICTTLCKSLQGYARVMYDSMPMELLPLNTCSIKAQITKLAPALRVLLFEWTEALLATVFACIVSPLVLCCSSNGATKPAFLHHWSGWNMVGDRWHC